MYKNKIIFYLIWLILFSLAPITIFLNTPLSAIILSPASMANTAQRLFGLWAFTLMFVQVILGSFMTKWTEKFGGWIFKFHVLEGIFLYLLILVHGFTFVFFRYFTKHGLDPFYVFVDVCVLCGKSFEFYYNFGRVGFWLVTIAVLTGLFRTATPFLRVHWRKFHVLNYAAFLLIGIHSFFLGGDISEFPFKFIYIPSLIIVMGILIFKGWNLYQTSRGKGK